MTWVTTQEATEVAKVAIRAMTDVTDPAEYGSWRNAASKGQK